MTRVSAALSKRCPHSRPQPPPSNPIDTLVFSYRRDAWNDRKYTPCTNTGVLAFTESEECVSALLSFKPSTLLLECLYAIFVHGGAHYHPAMMPAYLLRA